MTVFGVPLEDRMVLIMNEMLICGNLFANNIIIIGGGKLYVLKNRKVSMDQSLKAI